MKKWLISVFIILSCMACSKEEDPPVLKQDGKRGFSSGSGSGCTSLTYNGPTNDATLQAWCQAAQVYKCQGNQAGVDINCKNIEDFCNNCNCPYC